MQSHPLRIRWGEEKRKFKTLPPHLSHQEEGTLWKRVSLGRECQNTPTYFIYKFWRNKTFLPHLFCVGHSEHVLGAEVEALPHSGSSQAASLYRQQ